MREVPPVQEVDEPLRISPLNWRITWMILTFVALSLTASVLPLWPDIRESIPLDPLERRDALAFYSCSLLGFVLFLFPLFVCRPKKGMSVAPWWWVGVLTVGFAGIPLFVLSYIAGVHVLGAVGIILWAGSLLGLVLILLRLFDYRRRSWILVFGFLLGVVVPFVGWLREALADSPLEDPAWSPVDAVLRISQDFENPPVVGLAVACVAIHLLLGLMNRIPIRRSGTLVASLFVTVILGAAASNPRIPQVFIPSGSWMVPGQPLPLRVDGADAGDWVLDVAGRERFHWHSTGGATWLYPAILGEESVVLRREGRNEDGVVVRTRTLPGDRNLVLSVKSGDRPPHDMLPGDWNSEICEILPVDLPSSPLGYRCFSLVVFESGAHPNFNGEIRAALDDYVRRGGVIWNTHASKVESRSRGEGRVWTTLDGKPPGDLRPRSVADHPIEANLYSNFALPDWGRVDLTGLIILLVVYHVAFYLAFLLPLLIDAKKSMTVYLVSVGFVILIVVVAAWFALKSIFLRETQILQQNVGVYLLSDPGSSGPSLRVEQVSCFASFNEQAVRISMEMAANPRLVHENPLQGAGDIELDAGGRIMTLADVRLNRFRPRQVVKFDRVLDSPLRVERDGDEFRIRPVGGASDQLGLLVASKRAAFVRYNGNLFPARITGATIRMLRKPAERAWAGVLPADMPSEKVMPFIRHALGRYAPGLDPTLVVLLEGVGSLHEDESYLDRRDICQLLVVPLKRF